MLMISLQQFNLSKGERSDDRSTDIQENSEVSNTNHCTYNELSKMKNGSNLSDASAGDGSTLEGRLKTTQNNCTSQIQVTALTGWFPPIMRSICKKPQNEKIKHGENYENRGIFLSNLYLCQGGKNVKTYFMTYPFPADFVRNGSSHIMRSSCFLQSLIQHKTKPCSYA